MTIMILYLLRADVLYAWERGDGTLLTSWNNSGIGAAKIQVEKGKSGCRGKRGWMPPGRCTT